MEDEQSSDGVADDYFDADLDAAMADDDTNAGDDTTFAATGDELPAVSTFTIRYHEYKQMVARLRQERSTLVEERTAICQALQKWLESHGWTCVPVVVRAGEEERYLRLINTFTRKHLGSVVYNKAVQLLQLDLINQVYKEIQERRQKEYKKACLAARKAAGLTGRKKTAAVAAATTTTVVVAPDAPTVPTLAEVFSEAFLQSVKDAVKSPRVVVMLSDTKERGTHDDTDEDDNDTNDGGVSGKKKKKSTAASKKKKDTVTAAASSSTVDRHRPKMFEPLAAPPVAETDPSLIEVKSEVDDPQSSQQQDLDNNGDVPASAVVEPMDVDATLSRGPRYVIPGDIYAKIQRLSDIDDRLSELRCASSEETKRLEQSLEPYNNTVMGFVNRVSPKTKSAPMNIALPEGDKVSYVIRVKTYRRQPPLNIKELPDIVTDTLNVLRSAGMLGTSVSTMSQSLHSRDDDDDIQEDDDDMDVDENQDDADKSNVVGADSAVLPAATNEQSDASTSVSSIASFVSMLDQPFSEELAVQILHNVQVLNQFGDLITNKSYDARKAKAKAKEVTRVTLDKKIIPRTHKKRPRQDDAVADAEEDGVDPNNTSTSPDGNADHDDAHVMGPPPAQRRAIDNTQ